MLQPSLLKSRRRPIVGCYNFRPGHVRRWLWTHVGLRIFPQRSKIGSGEGVDSACIVGAGGGQIRVSKVPATLRVRNIVDNFQIRYLAQSDCFIALKDHSGGWNHMCEPLWTTDSGDSWPGCACAQCLVAREGAAFEVWCVLASQQQQQADHSSSTAIPGVAASGRTQARLRRLSPSWHQSVRVRAPGGSGVARGQWQHQLWQWHLSYLPGLQNISWGVRDIRDLFTVCAECINCVKSEVWWI